MALSPAGGPGSSTRTGGIAGMAFGVGTIVFLGLLLSNAPVLTDSMADIREYFDDKSSYYFIVQFFGGLIFVFAYLIFASALRSVLASADGDAGMWARASFGGAVAGVTMAGVGTLFWSALALDGAEGFSDGLVQALMNLDALVYGVMAPLGFALFLVGASVVIYRSGALRRWLAWLGFGAAALLIVGGLWVLDGDPESPLGLLGLLGFLVFLIWSATAGWFMYKSEA